MKKNKSTCNTCEHHLSWKGEEDIFIHMWCDKKDRDFSLGHSTIPCELYKED